MRPVQERMLNEQAAGRYPFTFTYTARACHYYWIVIIYVGARGSIVVKELSYKTEGRGFETR
jgi:hypothetical protein